MPILLQQAQNLSTLELKVKEIVDGNLIGKHRSLLSGFSVEFLEHRTYNIGDYTKDIDWKLYAKTGKYFVKKYENETNLRLNLVLDISGSMFYPASNNQSLDSLNKIGFACYASAVLAYAAYKQRDAFSVNLIHEKVHFQSTCKSSPNHLSYLLQNLDTFLSNNTSSELHTTNLSATIHQLAASFHSRSILVIFSDFSHLNTPEKINEFAAAMQYLKYKKISPRIYHLTDYNTEINLDLGNQPLRMVDQETGEELKLNPIEFKNEYQKLAIQNQKNIQQILLNNAIPYQLVDIGLGFTNWLLSLK